MGPPFLLATWGFSGLDVWTGLLGFKHLHRKENFDTQYVREEQSLLALRDWIWDLLDAGT